MGSHARIDHPLSQGLLLPEGEQLSCHVCRLLRHLEDRIDVDVGWSSRCVSLHVVERYRQLTDLPNRIIFDVSQHAPRERQCRLASAHGSATTT